jgi:hypothetical protein
MDDSLDLIFSDKHLSKDNLISLLVIIEQEPKEILLKLKKNSWSKLIKLNKKVNMRTNLLFLASGEPRNALKEKEIMFKIQKKIDFPVELMNLPMYEVEMILANN